ncbi:MAG: YggT family protein [Nitrospiraceae bacterium]|jgi:YggT family protein|nr:YggT family protein [Nitrospiraceae bacterium]
MSGNFVIAAAEILNLLLELYTWVIIIAAIISWVNPDPYNSIVRFLHRVTAPVLNPVRRLIGGRLGPIDISPLIVIFAIFFLQRFLVRSLIEFGYRLKGGF